MKTQYSILTFKEVPLQASFRWGQKWWVKQRNDLAYIKSSMIDVSFKNQMNTLVGISVCL